MQFNMYLGVGFFFFLIKKGVLYSYKWKHQHEFFPFQRIFFINPEKKFKAFYVNFLNKPFDGMVSSLREDVIRLFCHIRHRDTRVLRKPQNIQILTL